MNNHQRRSVDFVYRTSTCLKKTNGVRTAEKTPAEHQNQQKRSGGKSTQFSFLNKSKDTLKENDSSKGESHPVKYYLSESNQIKSNQILFVT